MRSLAQQILIDFAIFHNDEEIVGWIRDQPNLLQGIAVNENQNRQCPGFHNAELAGIRIAGTR